MLAQALAPTVRVNAVAPGPTMASARQAAEDFARQSAAVPLGRGPLPEEIAAAIVYLAGARSVTGVTLAVDGGQHLAWATPDASIVE
jgi:NAD(P)-dependent dehydrogenase (short-subunit alcohol dehydrogenase family)